jgi:hypothetical protein
VAGREGNTLSPVVRQAWDGHDLRVLTKTSPAVATAPHIASSPTSPATSCCATSTAPRRPTGLQPLPVGLRPPLAAAARRRPGPGGGTRRLVDRLTDALAWAREAGELRRDEEAKASGRRSTRSCRMVAGPLRARSRRGPRPRCCGCRSSTRCSTARRPSPPPT